LENPVEQGDENVPRYELWESADGREVTVTLADDPNKDLATKDTNGRPMVRVKEFEANDWDAAKQRRNDHYGWGPYKRHDL
jgi:hypothetical protein